jgi:hypothetical protein
MGNKTVWQISYRLLTMVSVKSLEHPWNWTFLNMQTSYRLWTMLPFIYISSEYFWNFVLKSPTKQPLNHRESGEATLPTGYRTQVLRCCNCYWPDIYTRLPRDTANGMIITHFLLEGSIAALFSVCSPLLLSADCRRRRWRRFAKKGYIDAASPCNQTLKWLNATYI